MKKLIILILFPFCSFAQSFTAETGYLFSGTTDVELNGSIKVLSGILKKTDKIDIYAETGRKFTASIVRMTDKDSKDINEVKAGQYAYFDLKFTANPSTGSDYLRNGYKVYPMGFQVNTTALKADAESKLAKSVNFKTTLDGKPFRGVVTYKGVSYWRKGVKNLVEKPYLQLQFRCVDSPDDRILTIQVFKPKESTAKYSVADMEVNFSGTMDGNKNNTTIYGFVNGKADTQFTLEITKWQTVSNNKAIVSGIVSGELREIKILGRATKTNKFENGVFENIEVEVFNDQPDFKEMMKKGGGR
jgi:hypothetical protein